MQQMTDVGGTGSTTSVELASREDITTFEPAPYPVRRQPGVPMQLATGIGWFSIGLGLTELLAPRGLARWLGIRDDRDTRRTLLAMGLRELASGLGILTTQRRAPWLWFRVGGDLLDLALLRRAARSKRLGPEAGHLGAAALAVAGAAALDAFAAQALTGTDGRVRTFEDRACEVTEVITINRSAEDVYRFWRQLSNLPQFMAHVVSVDVQDERRSHWKVTAAAGQTVEWDAEIVDDRPNERIAWRSVEGADVENAGTVSFLPAPGQRGTIVRVDLRYAAPGGKLGAALAKLLGREPGQQAKSDLRRLKQVLETGEVVHSDASIHRGTHAAQPFLHKPSSLKSPELQEEVP